MSICLMLLLVFLGWQGTCMSYGQFIVNRDICKNEHLNSCEFQPLNVGEETLHDD